MFQTDSYPQRDIFLIICIFTIIGTKFMYREKPLPSKLSLSVGSATLLLTWPWASDTVSLFAICNTKIIAWILKMQMEKSSAHRVICCLPRTSFPVTSNSLLRQWFSSYRKPPVRYPTYLSQHLWSIFPGWRYNFQACEALNKASYLLRINQKRREYSMFRQCAPDNLPYGQICRINFIRILINL